MFCNKCGKELLEDSRICPYCGFSVQAYNAQPQPQPNGAAEPEQNAYAANNASGGNSAPADQNTNTANPPQANSAPNQPYYGGTVNQPYNAYTPNYNQNAYSAPNAAPATEVDELNIGFCILSFFVPLFGIVYWAIKGKELPKKAKPCGIVGIASMVLSTVGSFILSFVLGFLGAFLETL